MSPASTPLARLPGLLPRVLSHLSAHLGSPLAALPARFRGRLTVPLVAAGLFAMSAAAAAGCSGDDDGPDDPVAPTYWQDVQPILHTHCSSCHVEGGIAPFALDDAQTATSMAGLLAKATSERTMPPWPPGGATPPLLHTRSMSQAQIDTIAA